MRSLLQLFVRFGGLFLFVLLEGICFYLVVQFNTKQGQIWFSSANVMVGKAYDTYDSASDFLHLKEEVVKLQEDNARLRRELEATHPSLDTMITDTARLDTIVQIFSYIPADIINNSVSHYSNYLTLDKGLNKDVRSGMGVINEDGVIGIVGSASRHYASVRSILHRETRISAAIKHKQYFGSLVWPGKDIQYLELQAIPKYAEIGVEDTVVTSGYSSIFPAGLYIGLVDEIDQEDGDNFYRIRVKLGIDMGKVQHALVVNNLRREELKKLSEGTEDE